MSANDERLLALFHAALQRHEFREALDLMSVDAQRACQEHALRSPEILAIASQVGDESVPLVVAALVGWVLGFSGAVYPDGEKRQAAIMSALKVAAYTAGWSATAVGGRGGVVPMASSTDRVQ